MSEPFLALFTHAMVYSDEIEDKIDQIMPELKRRYPGLTNYRWHALKLLEEDKEITEKYPVNLPQVLDRSYESDIINQKYDFIGEIIGEVLLHKERQDLLTERADKLLTSKVWSIPIFLGIMAVTFFLTFTIGDWIKGYFELGINTDTGEAAEGAVRADLTVTFDSCKPLHTAPSAAPFCGEIVCADMPLQKSTFPYICIANKGKCFCLAHYEVTIAKDTVNSQ